MKYSKEFKLECIMKYKNGQYINIPPDVSHKSFHKQIRRWIKIFESMGEYGLEHNRPTITVQHRIKLFMRVENGESYTQVATSVGIHEGLLIKWHKIYLQNGIEGLKSPEIAYTIPKLQIPINITEHNTIEIFLDFFISITLLS